MSDLLSAPIAVAATWELAHSAMPDAPVVPVRRRRLRLRRVSAATTVRVRGDEVLLSDGPFAETKEQVGGYDLIECENLDEAVEVASKHPVARFGTIEVRPIWEE